jgi:hypothetical protein
MTQIMGLLNLAPDIQEALLFLPKTTRGRNPIGAPEVLKLGSIEDWGGAQGGGWRQIGHW